MVTNCPRCNKEFVYVVPSHYEWIFCKRLDYFQSAYVTENYDKPLCSDCLKLIGQQFYQISVNPRYSRFKS